MPNTTNRNIQTGKRGEEIAAGFLSENGLKIIKKNIRTEYGEIDILCEEGECIVFVEVKTRRSKKFGLPEAAVTAIKQNHMINSAQAYLQENDLLERSWRIDVIAINMSNSKYPKIHWFRNAIIG